MNEGLTEVVFAGDVSHYGIALDYFRVSILQVGQLVKNDVVIIACYTEQYYGGNYVTYIRKVHPKFLFLIKPTAFVKVGSCQARI